MEAKFTESTVEDATIDWLGELGFDYVYGGDIAPEEAQAERESYREVVLVGRLRSALDKINRHIPASARGMVIDEAIRKVTKPVALDPIQANRAFHKQLVEGLDVSYREGKNTIHEKLWLVDFETASNNDYLAVNQFTVHDVNPVSRAKTDRRPDVILFINGLPLVVIELKNGADEQADIESAFKQIQTYKDDISSLFIYNEGIIISDGVQARIGTLTSGWEWFKPWKTITGDEHYGKDDEIEKLEVLLKGVFQKDIFLDIVRNFTVFEDDGVRIIKKMAGYHQYHAVNKALEKTVFATSEKGDQRVGVIWHTQGSGKSLSMLFYAGKIIQHPAMDNPTIIVLTDRNDLDDQLFSTFAGGQELLRQDPSQADNREHLKDLLQVVSGGVVFTTIQKFSPDEGSAEYPMLSDRRNIVFIADEAHRSQYGFEARLVSNETESYITYGFAKYVRDALPNASFIGFTGTPIELVDANTAQVFGDYIDIYDVQRAIDDGATVPIFYEARYAKLHLHEEKRFDLDPEFELVTEGEELESKEGLKSKWSQLAAVVGSESRLAQVAQDIITHFEARLETMDGKAMIVCMSRQICADLYQQLITIRPDWHGDKDDEGVLKVVMSGSASDDASLQAHIRNKARRKALATRFKDAKDPFKIVIVRDMWLTGFDAPVLHTMYTDKPMHGHSLMQAIARVNRVFKDKPGGLVVDYLGIATELQEAIHQYTQHGVDKPAGFLDDAVRLMQTDYERVKAFYHRFDYSRFFSDKATERLSTLTDGIEHILSQKQGKKRYIEAVTKLSKSFALSIPDDRAVAIRDNVAFFQAVKAQLVKYTRTGNTRSRGEMEGAIRQLVSQAVSSTDIVDLFSQDGLKRPNLAILSDDFLQDVGNLPQKNLAVELLQKLLHDNIRVRSRKNAVQARSFALLLANTLQKYENRAVSANHIVEELIDMAKEFRDANQRGEDLGLNDDELAFYDALAENESAVDVMGNEQLTIIARELLAYVRSNVTIDWTLKESARARIRVLVKRILRKYGYPPDLAEKATDTVLEQAKLVAVDWTSG
ncbi:MAG: type I restriction endonuclease subunit R [Phototrophicaceae bacterium]